MGSCNSKSKVKPHQKPQAIGSMVSGIAASPHQAAHRVLSSFAVFPPASYDTIGPARMLSPTSLRFPSMGLPRITLGNFDTEAEPADTDPIEELAIATVRQGITLPNIVQGIMDALAIDDPATPLSFQVLEGMARVWHLDITPETLVATHKKIVSEYGPAVAIQDLPGILKKTNVLGDNFCPKQFARHSAVRERTSAVARATKVGRASMFLLADAEIRPSYVGGLIKQHSTNATELGIDPAAVPFAPPTAVQKYVSLVAHNHMKPSMMAFVASHVDFFSSCKIVTTGSTGRALEGKLGLQVETKVSSGPLGGDQEIGALISRRECGAVFFFRDPLSAHPHDADIIALTRLCDVHDVLTATNPRTGDSLVHALQTSPEHVAYMLLPPSDIEDSDVVEAYKAEQKTVIATVAGSK